MNKILKFVGVGVTVTLADFLIYSLMVMVVFAKNTDMVGVASVVSGVLATVLAYIMHSRITWKTRDPGKYGVIKFFVWNALMVMFMRPFLTWMFGLLTGLYEFAHMILPFFSFEFVESTGIYVLMTAVVMVLNYIFYDKLVFSGSSSSGDVGSSSSVAGSGDSANGRGVDKKQRKKVEVKHVRKTGKEEKGDKKTKNGA